MVAAEHQDIILWLLSVLCFVVVMAGLMVFLVIQWRHRKSFPGSMEPDAAEDRLLCLPSPQTPQFTAKRATTWLAIKSGSVQAVQSALSLHNSKPCSWAEGLSGDHEQSLFVSPPVAGWILVIGPALPDPAEDVDSCYRFLADLSRKLGHVQFFHVHSILNHHAWVRIDTGRVIRAYAWAGKTLWNQGPPTPAEHTLHMRCYDYGESADPSLLASAEMVPANADKVHLLAARWSLDPDEPGLRGVGRERGIIGEASGLF
jgi:hypothetical protein